MVPPRAARLIIAVVTSVRYVKSTATRKAAEDQGLKLARQLAVLRERAKSDRESLEVFAFCVSRHPDRAAVEGSRTHSTVVLTISFSRHLNNGIFAYPRMPLVRSHCYPRILWFVLFPSVTATDAITLS